MRSGETLPAQDNASGATSPVAPGVPALEVRDVAKSFGPVCALDGVSLRIRAGTIHGVVGQNGAGKSTLMQVLAGVHRPDRGAIVVGGEEVALRSPEHARRRGIRIIYQELNLVPYQSVAENIFLGIEPRRYGLVDRRAMRKRSRALLDELGTAVDVDVPVGELNIGQQQVVEIAKALACDAELLILDEPTAALEMHDIEKLFALLERLRRRGHSALYVSHRLDELFRICDDVTVLRDGQVVGTRAIRDVSHDDVVHMMIGRSLAEVFPPRGASQGEVTLELKELCSGTLNHVSVEARAGGVLGVVGLEGSGLRELGRVIGGAQRIRRGEMRIGQRSVRPASPREAIEAGAVYLSADRKQDGLFPILDVRKNIGIASLRQTARLGIVSGHAEKHLVADSITRLAIRTPNAEQEVRFLSGGNQQKVLLARWLALRPRVFVLDEPTRGIDVGSKAEIYALIRRLTAAGATVVVTSTDLPEVLGLSDEIVVLRDGSVTARLPGTSDEHEVLAHVVGAKG